jgi:hypothetical protein
MHPGSGDARRLLLSSAFIAQAFTFSLVIADGRLLMADR